MYSKQKSLDRNEKALELSLSAVKFLLELLRSAAKYRCHSNNRTRKISLKNRSKRNFAYYRQVFAKFIELRLQGVTKHRNGTERNGIYRNKPVYPAMRGNDTGMGCNEQEW